jgi:hypothetical protein
MIEQPERAAAWRTEAHRRAHFRLHGHRLRLRTVEEYDASARETIRLGVRVSYMDLDSGEDRVGYFDPDRGRFTGLSADERFIVTHFRATARYVRRLLNVDYE